MKITNKNIEDNLARVEMAESVELPAETWEVALLEIQELRKFAQLVNELFNCTDGLITATGECNKLAREVLMESAKIAHRIKYELVEEQPQ